MTLSTLAELSMREEPATPEELGRLALVLKRIEGTDKLRLAREQATAKAAAKAAAGAGQAPGQAPPRKGLSPETVDLIDEAVVGFRFRPRPPVTSAPVDPWNPSESRESHLIPLNPGESRPENVSDVSSFISLNGGRLIISLKRRALRGVTASPAPRSKEPLRRTRGAQSRRPGRFAARFGRSARKARGAPCVGRTCPDWPGSRPSIGPSPWRPRREMPGTSPGMTRWVGRSGVGHEEGRTAGRSTRPRAAPYGA